MASVFSRLLSDHAEGAPRAEGAALSSLPAGARGIVVEVLDGAGDNASRLAALGVTPGANVTVLQTFPVLIFQCDQTEVAVERAVGRHIVVDLEPHSSIP